MAERFIALAQDPGSDGSSTQGKANGSGEDHAGATFLTAPLSANSNTNIGNSNADGVMTPKVYRYVIETGSMTASSTNGTVCSKDSAQFDAADINTPAKADTCERGNIRFESMINRLGLVENILDFTVTSETAGDVGVPTASSTFTVTYARQPVHPDANFTAGANTVKRLAAEGIQCMDDNTYTVMRHVYEPNTTVDGFRGNLATPAASAVPQKMTRRNVTVPKLANNIAALYANMTVTETALNPTHSLL